MSIESLIYDRLKASTAFTTVGGRVHLIHAPLSTKTPFIVYLFDNEEQGLTLSGSSNLAKGTLSISCYHDNSESLGELVESVKGLFQDWHDLLLEPAVRWCSYEGKKNAGIVDDTQEERMRYLTDLSFEIQFDASVSDANIL